MDQPHKILLNHRQITSNRLQNDPKITDHGDDAMSAIQAISAILSITRSRRSTDHPIFDTRSPAPNISAQYRSRGKVTVACAGISFASSFFTA